MLAPVARCRFVLETEPSLGFLVVTRGPEDTANWRQTWTPFGDMEGQLVATKMSPQLVLEQLWTAFLVLYECVTCASSLWVLPGGPGVHCGGSIHSN